MKKSLLLFSFLLFAYFGNAQLRQGVWSFSGEWLVGGSLFESNLWHIRSAFNPKLGYFFSDKLEAGAGLFFEYAYSDPALLGRSSSFHTMGLNPYLRFFPGKNTKQLLFFTELDAAVFHNYRDQVVVNEWWSYRASAGIGLHLFLSSQVALEGKLAYHFVQQGEVLSSLDIPNKLPSFDLSMRFYLNTLQEETPAPYYERLRKGRWSVGLKGITPLANSSLGFNRTYNLWFGLFVRDNLFIGTGLGMDLEIPQVWQLTTLAPFLQEYFAITDNLQWFAVGQLGLDFYSFSPVSPLDNFVLVSGRLGFGLNYFLNNSVSLEASLNYNQNFNGTDKDLSSVLFARNGVGLDVGVRFFLPG